MFLQGILSYLIQNGKLHSISGVGDQAIEMRPKLFHIGHNQTDIAHHGGITKDIQPLEESLTSQSPEVKLVEFTYGEVISEELAREGYDGRVFVAYTFFAQWKRYLDKNICRQN